jgi:hypothetical protein
MGFVAETPYKIHVKRGDFEFEVIGDKEFVVTKAKEIESRLFVRDQTSARPQLHGGKVVSATGMPKTMKEKLTKLRDDGFFSEPKGSPEVTAEFRTRGWGVFKSKDVSKALLVAAPVLELRRMSLGKNRFAYAYP